MPHPAPLHRGFPALQLRPASETATGRCVARSSVHHLFIRSSVCPFVRYPSSFVLSFTLASALSSSSSVLAFTVHREPLPAILL